MSTDRLIDKLVADLRPVGQRSLLREGSTLALLGVVEISLYVILGYARPDIHAAMTLPSFWWKLISLGVLSVVGVVASIRSFDPAASPSKALDVLAALVVAALVIGLLIDGAAPVKDGLVSRLMWRHGVDCVVAMTTLSLPAIVSLGFLMRRGAPTELRRSALTVGIAGAAWGAFVFVLNCPHDDPLYIAVWYVVGCSIVTLVSRLILPRVTRW